MFEFKDKDFFNSSIIFNQSSERDACLNIIKALKYYADKNDYEDDDILILDIGSNVEWYTTVLGIFQFSIISFEPSKDKYYLLKKNYCRNHKNFITGESTVIIINKALYPINIGCNYYQKLADNKNKFILCDKSKEKNLDSD